MEISQYLYLARFEWLKMWVIRIRNWQVSSDIRLKMLDWLAALQVLMLKGKHFATNPGKKQQQQLNYDKKKNINE